MYVVVHTRREQTYTTSTCSQFWVGVVYLRALRWSEGKIGVPPASLTWTTRRGVAQNIPAVHGECVPVSTWCPFTWSSPVFASLSLGPAGQLGKAFFVVWWFDEWHLLWMTDIEILTYLCHCEECHHCKIHANLYKNNIQSDCISK